MARLQQVWWNMDANEWQALREGDEIVSNERPVEDTYDDLRGREGLYSGQIAIALGKDSVGDNQGKEFYWDPDSTASDDDDTVLKPTGVSGAGRWLQYFDTYNTGEVYSKSESDNKFYSKTESDNKFQPIVQVLYPDDTQVPVTTSSP